MSLLNMQAHVDEGRAVLKVVGAWNLRLLYQSLPWVSFIRLFYGVYVSCISRV